MQNDSNRSDTPGRRGQSLTDISSPAPLAVDKADRITKLLNSAMKEEKKSKKQVKKDSAADAERIRELETRLATCLKEYKKYKEECFVLKSEKDSNIEEIATLSALNTELQDTLEAVNEQLLQQEAASEDRELNELSQAKSIAILEKENLLLQNKLDDAHDAAAETLSDHASAKLKISDLEKQLAIQQTKCEDADALRKSLRDTQIDYEEVQTEMKAKDSEIAELLVYMKKLEDLQVIEKDISVSSLEAVQAENRKLRMEVSELTDSVQSLEADVATLNDKKVECGKLEVANEDLLLKVSQLSDTLQSLETDCAVMQETRGKYDDLITERDELKESLELFEQEESSTVSKYKASNIKLQNALDDMTLQFDTFKEDTAATLEDKNAEGKRYCKEISDLQAAVELGKDNETALNEKKKEIEKLLHAVDTFQEALECGRQEANRLKDALDVANIALEKLEAQQSAELSQESSEQNMEVVESNDNIDLLRQAHDEIETLKQQHSDLESITAEKSLHAMDLTEKIERLQEEYGAEKEKSQILIEELQNSLSTRENEISDIKTQHKTELSTGRKALQAAEKEKSDLNKALKAAQATQSESSGLNKRMQVLKTQKEATQQRAEAAEGKLLSVSSQLAEMTRAHEALEKEKVLFTKQILRLEKAVAAKDTSVVGDSGNNGEKHSGSPMGKRAGSYKGESFSSHSDTKKMTNDDSNIDLKAPTTLPRDLTISVAIAATFLYLGTLIAKNPSP